jgi:hypothetical protein
MSGGPLRRRTRCGAPACGAARWRPRTPAWNRLVESPGERKDRVTIGTHRVLPMGTPESRKELSKMAAWRSPLAYYDAVSSPNA